MVNDRTDYCKADCTLQLHNLLTQDEGPSSSLVGPSLQHFLEPCGEQAGHLKLVQEPEHPRKQFLVSCSSAHSGKCMVSFRKTKSLKGS
jgi:hypothetical protein